MSEACLYLLDWLRTIWNPGLLLSLFCFYFSMLFLTKPRDLDSFQTSSNKAMQRHGQRMAWFYSEKLKTKHNLKQKSGKKHIFHHVIYLAYINISVGTGDSVASNIIVLHPWEVWRWKNLYRVRIEVEMERFSCSAAKTLPEPQQWNILLERYCL